MMSEDLRKNMEGLIGLIPKGIPVSGLGALLDLVAAFEPPAQTAAPTPKPEPERTRSDETTQAEFTEEPIEDRLARAYANGFRDGLERSARGGFDR